jgi:CRISPR-associated protein Cmr6
MPEEKKRRDKKRLHDASKGAKGEKKGDTKPGRWLPLYCDLRRDGNEPFLSSEKQKLVTANTGLIFDKFCDVWSGPGLPGWKPEAPKGQKSVKQGFLDEIVGHFANNHKLAELLKQYHKRREELIKNHLKGDVQSFKTEWRFVSGLGMGHVLETGFVWHRTLGVPYLPGSSVKGLVKAWTWKNNKKEAVHLFGPEGEEARKNPDTGALIVFDAIPAEKPKLEVDIMNPHYGDYYSKKKLKDRSLTPPADYLSPNPIFFLTVAGGMPFEFALAPRNGDNACVNRGFELLKEALENLGAGGKTAVGYGYFVQC